MSARKSILALALLAVGATLFSEDIFSAQNPLSQTGSAAAATVPAANSIAAANPDGIVGIWENASRFVEFSRDGKMRIVLKPYYGFVYEDTGALPCAGATDNRSSEASTALVPSSSVYTVSVRYTGEKYEQLVPLAVIGDGMYFRFFRRIDTGNAVPAAATVAPASLTASAAPAGSLEGFWLASGNADELRIYRSEEAEDFFSYYFSGSNYYRIRYWKTDALKRDVSARVDGTDGKAVEIPKFITIGESLYTCITSTGTTLRNYEKGTWSLAAGKIAFAPSNVVYAGTSAAVRNPVAFTLSGDGAVLALGSPYLAKSKIVGLDAEIKAHNGLRRPPRKPVFDYMKLDFHWDEVEKVRNNGQTPAEK